MFRFLIFTSLLLLSRSCNGYEDFLGLAEDYDNQRAPNMELWELTKDSDIWNEKKSDSAPVVPQENLRNLCENYDLLIGDQTIDCEDLKLVQKSLKVENSHVLQKREAEHEAPLEGSGDGEGHHLVEHHVGEDKPIPEDESHKHSEDVFSLQSGVVVDKNTPDAEKGDTAEHVEKNAEITSTAEEKPSEAKPAEEKPTEDKPTEEKPAEDKVAEVPSEEKPNEDKKTGEISEGDKKPTEDSPLEGVIPVTTPAPAEEKQIDEKPSDHSNPSEQKPETEQTTSAEIPKEQDNVQPPAEEHDIGETTKSSPEIATQALGLTPKESHHEQPAPNSLDKATSAAPQESNPSTVADKKGRKLVASSDQNGKEAEGTARVGEATESVSKKDTKILLGLFGAVVGVGIAAYTYNHFRKKKNSARATINGISKEDPEQGKEMKPLMKSDDSSSIDYKNEKQDKSEVRS